MLRHSRNSLKVSDPPTGGTFVCMLVMPVCGSDVLHQLDAHCGVPPNHVSVGPQMLQLHLGALSQNLQPIAQNVSINSKLHNPMRFTLINSTDVEREIIHDS